MSGKEAVRALRLGLKVRSTLDLTEGLWLRIDITLTAAQGLGLPRRTIFTGNQDLGLRKTYLQSLLGGQLLLQ